MPLWCSCTAVPLYSHASRFRACLFARSQKTKKLVYDFITLAATHGIVLEAPVKSTGKPQPLKQFTSHVKKIATGKATTIFENASELLIKLTKDRVKEVVIDCQERLGKSGASAPPLPPRHPTPSDVMMAPCRLSVSTEAEIDKLKTEMGDVQKRSDTHESKLRRHSLDVRGHPLSMCPTPHVFHNH